MPGHVSLILIGTWISFTILRVIFTLMYSKQRISVFGGRDITPDVYQDTLEIGRRLADERYMVFCGGGAGVMEAIAKGVHDEGGIVIGVLKGQDLEEGNKYLTVPIATGIGIARNAILAYNCDAAIAISGQYGTLSEIAYACLLYTSPSPRDRG